MELNLSNLQIASELDLNEDDVRAVTSCLRDGLVAKAPEVKLEGVVEIDEVYVVAGHKNPAATQKKPPRALPAPQGNAGPRHSGKGGLNQAQNTPVRPQPDFTAVNSVTVVPSNDRLCMFLTFLPPALSAYRAVSDKSCGDASICGGPR
jgi:hypothetical protein